jgi:patched domain-containing protein
LWSADIRWDEADPYRMKAFRFFVGIRRFAGPNDHRETAELMRSIAARYSDYNVTTYHEYYPFADQYITITPTTWRNFALGVASMIAIAMLLIPNMACGFVITFAMVSIDTGVNGYMVWWGVNLDAISMISLIMCVAFSVDLSSHIAYAYVLAKGNAHEKAVAALETLGWPVFQGAFSTILGILVLASVDAYMIQTFFKTIFLVILCSLVHGLVFLPVGLTLVMPLCSLAKWRQIAACVCPSAVKVRPVVDGTAGTSKPA